MSLLQYRLGFTVLNVLSNTPIRGCQNFHLRFAASMKSAKYLSHLIFFSRGAEILDHSKTPCTNPDDFVPSTEDKIYTFYIRMDNVYDFTTWKNVAKCLKIWDLDPRGYHKSLWRLWFNGNHILIVGCPASPHCIHKPSSLQPIYIPKTQTRLPD